MRLFSTSSFNPLTDLPDLSGKVIIVTGGNAGIGYATVKHLARKGAKVYMAARNRMRAEAAIAKLRQEGLGPGNGEVVWLELDLADPRNARKTAQEFMSKEERLDILVHNAALLAEKSYTTPDGVDMLFLVNVISPFVLNRELMPILNHTASKPNTDVRIVVVGSDAYKLVPGEPRFRNLDDFNNEFKTSMWPQFARYAYSKLANVLYASELHRKLEAQGSPVTVITVYPGAVNTFSRRPELRRISWLVDILLYPFFMHPDRGGYTSAFAAGSSEIGQHPEKFKGAYLLPFDRIGELRHPGNSEELARELWVTIEEFLTEKGV